MFGTLADLLGNANGQTPLVVVLAGSLLIAAGYIGNRVFRSLRRQGARVGALEQSMSSEITRRRQVEQVLREHRIRLPYWPDDPAALYVRGPLFDDPAEDLPAAAPAGGGLERGFTGRSSARYEEDEDYRDEDDQVPDDWTRERPRIPVPPIDVPARHRRTGTL